MKLPRAITKPATEPMHLVIDSTGLKVYGEGEWKVRQHGYSKRRTWKKLHLIVDAKTHKIAAATLTANDVHDGEMLPPLLAKITQPIAELAADGAYDHRKVYDLLAERKIRALIVPRRNAKIRRHGNAKGARHLRDENLRRIRKVGRKAWKVESGYHQRSLAETAMFRYKRIFGDRLRAREEHAQFLEAMICCSALNRMTDQGMPFRERVT